MNIESAKYYFDKATGIDPSAPDLVRLQGMLKKLTTDSNPFSF